MIKTNMVPENKCNTDTSSSVSSIDAGLSMIDILRLFEVAATQYEQGYLYEARTGFVAIIQKLKTIEDAEVCRVEDGNVQIYWRQTTKNDESCTNNVCQNLLKKASYEDSNEVQYVHIGNDRYFVHLHCNEIISATTFSPFEIFDGIMLLSKDILLTIESIGAVSIYNLAVINHIIGTSVSEKNQSFMFKKTLHLYAQAQSLVDILYSDNDEACECVSFTLLNAAINSNMAQIYRDHFMNTKISNQLIQSLNDIITFWKEEIFISTIPDEYFDFFTSHVHLSPHLNIQTAPAA